MATYLILCAIYGLFFGAVMAISYEMTQAVKAAWKNRTKTATQNTRSAV